MTKSGRIIVKVDGTVIDARHVVDGSIDVRANNVTITRTRVTYGGSYAIRQYDGYSGLVIEDVEVECSASRTNGIAFGNYVARRVTIEGCKNSFIENGGSTEIYDSFVDGKPFGVKTDERPSPVSDNMLLGDQAEFTRSPGGWVPQGNTSISRAANVGRSEDGALRVLVDENGRWPDRTRTARVGTPWGANGIPVTPGAAYLGAAWIKPAGNGSPARCEIRFYGSDGRILSTLEGPLQPEAGGEWNLRLCGGVAPLHATHASLRVVVAEADYGDVHFVDDAGLTRFGIASSVTPPTPPSTAAPTTTAPPATTTSKPPTTVAATPTTAAPAPTTTPPTSPPTSPPTTSPAPTSGGWASAASTGVRSGVALAKSGSISSTRDGQVIENLEVNGYIEVRHRNVTVRNVRINGSGRYGIVVPIDLAGQPTNLLVEDTEIRGVSGDRSAGFMSYGSATVRRTEVTGYQDGFKVYTNNTFDGNWCHDLVKLEGSHNDCMQATSGSNIVIRNNRLDGPYQTSTSAIILKTDSGTINNVTIENNYLSGGSYTLYLRVGSHGSPSNVVVRNNVWQRNSWSAGAYSSDGGTPGLVWSNNTYHDGTAL